jgi:hypothetical protein
MLGSPPAKEGDDAMPSMSSPRVETLDAVVVGAGFAGL